MSFDPEFRFRALKYLPGSRGREAESIFPRGQKKKEAHSLKCIKVTICSCKMRVWFFHDRKTTDSVSIRTPSLSERQLCTKERPSWQLMAGQSQWDKEMSCHRVPYNAARAPFDRGTLAVATRVAGYVPREHSARSASKTRRSLDRRRRANVVPLLPFSRHWGLIDLPLASRRRSRTAPPKPARWRSR